MGDWVQSDSSKYCAMGTVEQAQASRGTSIHGGAANTKGNYAQLIDSTPFEAHGIMFHIEGPMDVAARGLADIAIGPGGSEQIILNNLQVDSVFANVAGHFYFPISIPAKTRIAARCQNSNGGASVVTRVAGHVLSSGFAEISPLGKVVTYGANTSDSGGTPIDPGATAGTKGSWTQVTASTTAPILSLVICIGGDANGSRVATSWLFDLGIGSAGNETILIPNIPLVFNDAYIYPKTIGPLSISIPAASRIAVRAQCTNTDATDRLFDVVLYGVS